MKRRFASANFLKTYGVFLRKHPDLEQKIEEIMDRIATGERAGLSIHALHGKLAGFHSARISQEYRLIFVLNSDTVTFIDIGSHDEVY